MKWLLIFTTFYLTTICTRSEIPFKDLTVSLSSQLREESCNHILKNLQTSLTSSSRMLFNLTNHQIHKVTVIIPPSWLKSNCSSDLQLSTVSSASSSPDIRLTNKNTKMISVAQYGPCGEKAKDIEIPVIALENSAENILEALLKYQFGIFTSRGQKDDARFPEIYRLQEDEAVKNCGRCRFNESCYDDIAPTQHNLLCYGQSPISIIRSKGLAHEGVFFAPKMEYMISEGSRYILILDRSTQAENLWIHLHNDLYR